MTASSSDIQRASALIKQGNLVAFPTETVYGLGADATNPDAISKIYATKGRPSDNPLIIHLASKEDVRRYVEIEPNSRVEEQFEALSKLWPGPLTIVLPQKKSIISENASAGLNSIGIRIPSNKIARELLKEVALPIAAPSANRSQYISATTPEHVKECFGEELFVLDGGPCSLGLESTIIRITEDEQPEILRQGYITREQLNESLGEEVGVNTTIQNDTPLSPGQKRTHYSPHTPLHFVDSMEELSSLENSSELGLITFSAYPKFASQFSHYRTLSETGDEKEAAQALYQVLREFDQLSLKKIFIEKPYKGPLYPALVDRLERAVYKK